MHPFIKFRNNLIRNGLEYFGLYYGFYEGIVVENEDPDKRLRLKIKCPAVYGNVVFPKWARPFGIMVGDKLSLYAVPPIGSPVWVSFKGGDPEFPIWTYGWYPESYAPDGAGVNKYLFTTPAGHKLIFDEVDGIVKLYFDGDREISMSHGETILKSGDNIVTMKEKISINFNGVSMFELLKSFMETTSTSQMLGQVGPYNWDPNALIDFQNYIVELEKLME